MTPKKPPAQPNRSLIDGLECLEAVAVADGPVGVRELARMLGLEPTRVNRLLGTLAYLGLAEKTPDRKYIPGPGIHVLSAMGLRGSHLLSAALPVVRELTEQHKRYVAIGVLWRRHVCYIFHGGPGRSLAQGLGGHRLYPAEISSIGRILLANRPEEEVRELFANDPEIDVPKLLRELRQLRRKGHARATDGVSLAVPIGDTPVAAIAFSNIDPKKSAGLVKELRAAAQTIAEAL